MEEVSLRHTVSQLDLNESTFASLIREAEDLRIATQTKTEEERVKEDQQWIWETFANQWFWPGQNIPKGTTQLSQLSFAWFCCTDDNSDLESMVYVSPRLAERIPTYTEMGRQLKEEIIKAGSLAKSLLDANRW